MANLDILIRARNEAQAELNELDKSLGGLRKQAGGLSGGLTGLGNVLKVGLVAGAAAGAAALGAVGAAAFGVAQEFDDAQDTLIAMTGAGGAALDGMSASVVALHGTVAGLDRSMVDIAAVMGEVDTRTGATGPALDTFSSRILKMTRITGDDGVAAVREITRVMGDWSVPLEGSSGLMDKLFGAGQTFGIGLDSLAGKLVQFGAPLRQMGFGLDESIAMLGKWEKEGVNTELVIGSLRIAAGKFAKEQGESNDAVVGGVKSLADAQSQLDKLRSKLQLAKVQQAEFTDKTKASSRLAKEQQIAETTRQIEELESAMALGEFRTISSTAANKSLSESLRDTFAAIKNASDGTAALNIGMEVFGARAGPDMVAAIREGRFELDDAIAAMDGMAGSIDDVSERSLGFSERWQMGMTRVRDSLLPIGNELMGLGLQAMPFVEEAAGKLAGFLSTTLPGVIGDVKEAWAEDWGGIRSAVADTGLGIELEFIKMKLNAALLVQEIEKTFADADITLDWTGIKIPIDEKTQFVLEWAEVWEEIKGVAQRGLINIPAQIGLGFVYIRGAWKYGTSLLTGDWAGAWEGWIGAAGAGMDSILSMIDVWSPEAAGAMSRAIQAISAIAEIEWALMSVLFETYIATPIRTFFDWWDSRKGSLDGLFGGGTAPALAGYATGTDFAPGGWAIVGERGPELVELPRGSRVFPASETTDVLRSLGGATAGGGWRSAVGSVSEVLRSLGGATEGGSVRDVLRSLVSSKSVSSVFRSVSERETLRSLAQMPAYASGTDFAPGGLALVGERGRELVYTPTLTPSPSVSTGSTQAGGGEGSQMGGADNRSVTINNYVTVNNEQDIVSLTERILSQLRQQQGQQAWLPTF